MNHCNQSHKIGFWLLGLYISFFFISPACGVDFELDDGVKAASDHIIDVFEAHWGKMMVLCGLLGVIFSKSNLRSNALKAVLQKNNKTNK